MFICICWFIFIWCISFEPQTASLFTRNFKGALPYSESRTVPADKVINNKQNNIQRTDRYRNGAYQMTEKKGRGWITHDILMVSITRI